MQQILANHATILAEIQSMICQEFKFNKSDIQLSNVEVLDESILKFQLACSYSFSDPVKTISLSFEVHENSPQTLYFGTNAGLRAYQHTSQYHGLTNEIVKFVSYEIEN